MKYYTKTKKDINKNWLEYSQEIKWNTEEICNNEEGYIVQEVKIISNVIPLSHYYEAWHVLNNKCEDYNDSSYDDKFCHFNEGAILDEWEKILGNNNYVIYKTNVFWIERKNNVFKYVKNWVPCIFEARDLNSIPYDEAKYMHNLVPLFSRRFEHFFSLDSDDKIINSLFEYIIDRGYEKNLKILNDIIELIPNKYNVVRIKKEVEKNIMLHEKNIV